MQIQCFPLDLKNGKISINQFNQSVNNLFALIIDSNVLKSSKIVYDTYNKVQNAIEYYITEVINMQ